MSEEPNWQQIAMELWERVNFALNYLECPHYRGTGLVYNQEKNSTSTWQRYFAEGLGLIPGSAVDWESVEALSLPAKQRRKYFAEQRKREAAEKAASEVA